MTRAAAVREPTAPDQLETASLSRSRGGALGYFQRSELPLSSLLFLLPLIVLYELGTYHFASDPQGQTEQRIIAFNLLRDFFQFFGATGKYLPAMAVVGILLTWHIARNDPWSISMGTGLGMACESLILAVPLMGVGFLFAHYVPLMAAGTHWRGLIVLSLGAGIYEELIFRLVAFTLLHLLLVDLLKLRKSMAFLGMVLISSVLFAAYHYLGWEPFQLRTFAFRTVAGGYFGLIFLTRGFGVTAGCHAGYDLLIVLLRGFA